MRKIWNIKRKSNTSSYKISIDHFLKLEAKNVTLVSRNQTLTGDAEVWPI